MTRKEQITEFALEFFKAGMEADEIGMPSFDQIIQTEHYKKLIDDIFTLPLDVPGDEDVLNYAVDHNKTQKYTTIDYYATGRADGARWMCSEILKRNGM